MVGLLYKIKICEQLMYIIIETHYHEQIRDAFINGETTIDFRGVELLKRNLHLLMLVVIDLEIIIVVINL